MIRTPAISAAVLMSSTCLVAIPAAVAQDIEPDVGEVEVIVVRGAFIPDEKRETSEIAAVVDAADFSAAGDADAAAALVRVTGLSLTDGKFVIVRGLNERYSSATLNGSPLPSPEPLRRVAPLDLFPTNALESVLVQKTYSPEYSGEFGGGVIDLRTRNLPDQAYFDISTSVGFNSVITGEDVFTTPGGDSDFTGFDDGTRNRPPGFGNGFFDGAQFAGRPGNPDGDLQALTAAFADSRITGLEERTVAPNYGFGLNGGDRFDLNSAVSVGVIGGFGYSNDWTRREGPRLDPTITGSNDVGFDRDRVSNEITSNVLGSIGMEILGDHEVQLTFLGARSTENSTEIRSNFFDPSFDEATRQQNQWFERQAWITQLSGSHYFPGLKDLAVEWRASYSEALRDAPFQTEFTFDQDAEDDILFNGLLSDDFTRWRFELLADQGQDYGIDFELPVYVAGFDVNLEAGWAYKTLDRNTVARDVFLIDGGQRANNASVEEFILETGGVVDLIENPDEIPEAFQGDLETNAFYFAADAQLGPYIRAQAGVRFEEIDLTADAFTRDSDAPFAQVPGPDTEISSNEVLPAVTITWNPLQNQQIRFGYSETFVLPQFRELSPQLFVDRGELFEGNPFLVQTDLRNVDVRYEWYFGRDRFVTVGGFYKDIDNPIVQVTGDEGDSLVTSYINAPDATLLGAELEFENRLDLGNYFELGFLNRKELIGTFNYTYTDSEVGNDGEVISLAGFNSDGTPNALVAPADRFIGDNAQLQGQSEHLLNVSFGYEDFGARSSARFFYNFVGERVFAFPSLDESRLETRETLPNSLDFRYRRAFDVFNRELEFSFTARNITNAEYQAERDTSAGVRLVERYDIGRTISLGLTGRF